MWPLPPLENELVTFTISPHSVICSWIQKQNTKTELPVVRAHETHQLEQYEITGSLVCNPTHIRSLINTFLLRINKRNAYIALCLTGNQLQHYYLTLPNTSPHPQDFGIPPSHSLVWGYRFMYHNDDGLAVFYVYKMSRALLLQYQLIAIAEQLNLVSITTDHAALCATYKALFGPAFRHSQFALDMMRTNNQPEHIISTDTLKRMIIIPPTLHTAHVLSSLATSYGLFTLQGISL